MMTLKEYIRWMNERACDGRWGMATAIACIEAHRIVHAEKFWRRNKKWKEIGPEICRLYVDPTNELIEEYKRGELSQ